MPPQGPMVTRTETEFGWWELVTTGTPPHLRRYAPSMTGFRMSTLPLRTREIPTGSMWLIISFGDALDVLPVADREFAGGRFVSFAVGLQDGVGVTEHRGRQHGMQVELTPLGVRALLGVAPKEFGNACVELDDVLGNDAERLSNRLAEADWDARFSITSDWLASRFDEHVELTPEVGWAWRRLRELRGCISVADLVREVGWSRRHLAARFREQVGLTPKTVARILRFQHAVELSIQGDQGWVEVAARCGYTTTRRT